MISFLKSFVAIKLFLGLPFSVIAQTVVHHDLRVRLQPEQGWIEVEDRISFRTKNMPQPLCWTLPSGLQPALLIPEKGKLRAENGDNPHEQRFCTDLPPRNRQLQIHYAGHIDYPQLPTANKSRAPVSQAGVYLDGASNWYPRFGDELVTFKLALELPSHWSGMSQGRRETPRKAGRSSIEIWQENKPQQFIYLIAGDFQRYEKKTPKSDPDAVQIFALLRSAEPELAARYLDATEEYLDEYSRLLGPYPYAKFALVENFWESGYGMPSFTLLGPRVLRLPFILKSSYPHEILHSWWGNGVYVASDSGNWSEGLATYLGDYLLKERQGEGRQFRRSAIQRYNDYARSGREFPLGRFSTGHDAVARAVGYDKGVMFFHMLRLQFGDRMFLDGLRRFYQDYRFKRAGFAELQTSFETVKGEDLSVQFEQWLERTGAPQLELADVQVSRQLEQYRLSATLKQSQAGPPYHLRVPVAVQFAGARVRQTSLMMTGKTLRFSVNIPARPQRLAIDPEFDLLRRLDRAESPPSLNQLFGAERVAIVLPAAASARQKQAYRRLAGAWSQHPDTLVRWDDQLTALPDDRNIWLFGWENRFLDRFTGALQEQPVSVTSDLMKLQDQRFARTDFGVVLVAQAADDEKPTMGWLSWDDPRALERMAQKLRHYGKYSYLVFTGAQGRNVAKGQWPVPRSALNISVAPQAPEWRASLAPRPALTAGQR